ncbi:hypothetical protein B0W47_02100 [Komagataeibacter nataicola]|uniref:Replication-associated protein ORF2/G2P domain-containing protein n=2 Tax=Komagataeibacter nataicola TaxID=265960 RepID=A0A9N7CTR3_9PROT|nr:hypothetical protein [Komagataeibacter nataicola]AQU86440.1 hypothetical protein B0W47_02100 [Komagataeibacter nataicola]
MNVINKCENIKKKNQSHAKKFKPVSMWQMAEQESKPVIKPPAPSYTPLSMWQMAKAQPVIKQQVTRLRREHIPNISMLSDTDPVDVIRDDGTPERWTIGELKACLISHLNEYKKQGNDWASRVLSQFPDFNEIEPITGQEPITDDDSKQPTNWYHFGKNEYGKQETIKPIYDLSDNDRAKRSRLYRNRALLGGLEEFAQRHDYKGTFLTITCDRNNIRQSKQCITDIWNGLQKALHDRNIKNFGMKSMEQRPSGIWHMHAIIFTPSDIIDEMELNLYKKYANHPFGEGKCIQRITEGTAKHVARYITKVDVINDHHKQESKFVVSSETRFFGIPKGVIKSYDRMFRIPHEVNVFDNNKLSKAGRKRLASIKAGMTTEQKKQFNRERYIKLHIERRNMMTVLDNLGAFKDLKKCCCSWLSSETSKIQAVSFCIPSGHSKNGGNCSVVDKVYNINKKERVRVRGPTIAQIQKYAIMSIEKRSQNMETNTSHKHITGIPPPCRQHQYARYVTDARRRL